MANALLFVLWAVFSLTPQWGFGDNNPSFIKSFTSQARHRSVALKVELQNLKRVEKISKHSSYPRTNISVSNDYLLSCVRVGTSCNNFIPANTYLGFYLEATWSCENDKSEQMGSILLAVLMVVNSQQAA